MIMLKQCQDSYHSTFGTYEDMLDYHEEQVKASQWQRCQVNTLQVEPLDKASPHTVASVISLQVSHRNVR